MKRLLVPVPLLLLTLAGCDPHEVALHIAEGPRTRPDADPPVPSDPCQVHCTSYETVCAGESFAYDSYDQCEQLCPYWEDPDTFDNPAARCRDGELLQIDPLDALSVALGCAQAGPDSETCGSGYIPTCEFYCDFFAEQCEAHPGVLETGDCLAWCDTKALRGEGDTIECRIEQLTSLAAQPSCDGAAPSSTRCD